MCVVTGCSRSSVTRSRTDMAKRDDRPPTIRAFQYRNADDDSTYFLYDLYLWDKEKWTGEMGMRQALAFLIDRGMAKPTAEQRLKDARKRFKKKLAGQWVTFDSPRPRR